MKRSGSFSRESKVAGVVRHYVAEIIRDKYASLGITIVDAEARGGLSFVRLYYQGRKQDLRRLLSPIRFELAHRMNQKYVPQIELSYDPTLETADRIESLLKMAQ
ncbi:MAG: ribosome-binding factor A [Rickettsiales bacterium]|jgi:ribosome-binding factor A|nr:ribosome-binding factor A [Rickettsiales bacterium]